MRLAILFILIFPFICIQAQDPINSTEFFNQISRTTQNATQVSTPYSFKAPLFEDLDLRTETRDFDFDQQEYQFRFDLSTKAKRNAQKALFDIYTTESKSKTILGNENAIGQAYDDWLKLFFLNKTEEKLLELKLVIEDKVKVAEKNTLSLDLEIKNILETKSSLNDISISLLEIKLAKAEILESYNLENRNPVFNDLISIPEIIEFLFLKNFQFGTALREEFNLESEIIKREIELEEAEGKEYFDFGQIRYRGPHEDILEERISLAAALNLNRSGNRSIKIARLKMEQEELEYKYQNDLLEESAEAEKILKAIVRRNEILEAFSQIKQAEIEEADRLSSLIAKKEGVNPTLILQVKENKISVDLEKLNREKDIYEKYLDYLIKTKALWSTQGRNFLKS